MNAELSKWLEEVIDLQEQVSQKYKECPIEGISVCSSCLDTTVQFYRGLPILAKELGLDTVTERDYYGAGKDRIGVQYPRMELVQVNYRGEVDADDSGKSEEG